MGRERFQLFQGGVYRPFASLHIIEQPRQFRLVHGFYGSRGHLKSPIPFRWPPTGRGNLSRKEAQEAQNSSCFCAEGLPTQHSH